MYPLVATSRTQNVLAAMPDCVQVPVAGDHLSWAEVGEAIGKLTGKKASRGSISLITAWCVGVLGTQTDVQRSVLMF